MSTEFENIYNPEDFCYGENDDNHSDYDNETNSNGYESDQEIDDREIELLARKNIEENEKRNTELALKEQKRIERNQEIMLSNLNMEIRVHEVEKQGIVLEGNSIGEKYSYLLKCEKFEFEFEQENERKNAIQEREKAKPKQKKFFAPNKPEYRAPYNKKQQKHEDRVKEWFWDDTKENHCKTSEDTLKPVKVPTTHWKQLAPVVPFQIGKVEIPEPIVVEIPVVIPTPVVAEIPKPVQVKPLTWNNTKEFIPRVPLATPCIPEDSEWTVVKKEKPIRAEVQIVAPTYRPTKMCTYGLRCRKAGCTYAHAIEQLKPDDCRFGNCCNQVSRTAQGVYVNTSQDRSCTRLHPGETTKAYACRLGMFQ